MRTTTLLRRLTSAAVSDYLSTIDYDGEWNTVNNWEDFHGVPHPTTFQEAKGHGAFAWNGAEFPGSDGVVYSPSSGAPEVPSSGNDRSVAYRLVDTLAAGGMWARRADPLTYASFKQFRLLAGEAGQQTKRALRRVPGC